MKKYSEKLLMPLAKKVQKIPANFITVLSFISSILAGIGFAVHIFWFTLLSLFFIEFFDQLDGIVARQQGPTRFGAFLDSTLDRYGDIVILIGLWHGNYISSWIILVIFIGMFMTSYMRARAEALTDVSFGGVGILERTDRIPLLLLGVIGQFFYIHSIFISLILLAIGSNITTIQRFLRAYRILVQNKNGATK